MRLFGLVIGSWGATDLWIIVYEGDKIREEQQKRIEDELQDIAAPIETDKESILQQHIEAK